MEDNGHVLAFMAHPDDAEFLCAGTLARLRDRGYHIHLATATAGDGGSVELGPEQIARIRLEEARRAAEVLDASFHCAGEQDFLVSYAPASIRRFVEIVRLTHPFLVITHSPSDYMVDHEVTSQLVRNACFCASAPNMKTLALPPAAPTTAIPYLYYASPLEGKDPFGAPVAMARFVDVSGAIDVKQRMLACHASQRDWLLRNHGMDEYIDSMRRGSAHQGRQCGCAFAEGFRQHRGHAYPQDDILGALLG